MDRVNFFNFPETVQTLIENPSNLFEQDTMLKVGAVALGLFTIGVGLYAWKNSGGNKTSQVKPQNPFQQELAAAVASKSSESGWGSTEFNPELLPTYLEGTDADEIEPDEPPVIGTTVFKRDEIPSALPPFMQSSLRTLLSPEDDSNAGFMELCQKGKLDGIRKLLNGKSSTEGLEYLNQCVAAFEVAKRKEEKDHFIQGIYMLVDEEKLDVNATLKNGMSLLRFACSVDANSSTELVGKLLEKGADLKAKIDGKTPFDELSVEQVEQLLKREGLKEGTVHQELEILNRFRSALQNSCLEGKLVDAKDVLSMIDPNFKIEGKPFLHWLITNSKFVQDEESFVKILSIFIEDRRVDLAAEGPKKTTLLHLAAARQMPSVVDCLCASGRVNVNAVNQEGYTPLHTVCGGRFHLKTALAFLNHGADPSLNTVAGEQPFQLLHQDRLVFSGSLRELRGAIESDSKLQGFIKYVESAEKLDEQERVGSQDLKIQAIDPNVSAALEDANKAGPN